jgi:hypothetical protein
MHFLLLSLQLLLPGRRDSTPLPFPYFIKEPATPFEWKKVELSLPQHYKDSVMRYFEKEYADYLNQYPSREDFVSSFHFVNLNGDAWPDLIYEGPAGGEGTVVTFYLNKKRNFLAVFDDVMVVKDLVYQDKKLQSFVIVNYGCCAETVEFERHFSVDSLFHCHLVIQRAILQGMEVNDKHFGHPDGYFDSPVKFRVKNAEYALRYGPAITDTLPADADLTEKNDKKGDIIAQYPEGSRGYAWAYKKDDTGREWWLVEMEPAVFLSFNRFWDYDNKLTRYFGWMSSRFLEKLP